MNKPWGREIIWAHTDKYAGKILEIKKGNSLSLQYHKIKEETIYLLTGKIKLTYGEEEKILLPEDSFHIPPGLVHRMEALEDSMVFEVSTPELDDVVRLEDNYGRV